MTVLLGLRDDLADGFCDGVVAIVMDVGDWLRATTWIAPVVGGAAGFVSSDLGGVSVAGLGSVGVFGCRRRYIKKWMGGDGYVYKRLGRMGKGCRVQGTLTLLCAERAFCRPCEALAFAISWS